MTTPELTELERLQAAVREAYDHLTNMGTLAEQRADEHTANGDDLQARLWSTKSKTYSLARASLKASLYGHRVHVPGVMLR